MSVWHYRETAGRFLLLKRGNPLPVAELWRYEDVKELVRKLGIFELMVETFKGATTP